MEVKDNGNGSHSLYCDCCGREKLAELRGDKLVIMDRRHGKRHIAVLPLSDLLRLAEGAGLTTSDSSV